jgi:hypothetical protein
MFSIYIIQNMELFLWMWFYDSRWFFNFKISVKCYKYAWLIPLFTNTILSGICFYFLHTTDSPNCEASLKLWLFSRTFFSVLISVNILFFMYKISNVYQKESSFFGNALKIYPSVKQTIENYDYWIRRKSLISTPGVLLLFLGIISLFWSYIMINLYYFEGKFVGCDEKILSLLNFNSFLIFIGNIPLLLVIIVLLLIKITSFVSAYLCPNLLIKISKLCTSHKIRKIIT